jgi:hypothetical protein
LSTKKRRERFFVMPALFARFIVFALLGLGALLLARAWYRKKHGHVHRRGEDTVFRPGMRRHDGPQGQQHGGPTQVNTWLVSRSDLEGVRDTLTARDLLVADDLEPDMYRCPSCQCYYLGQSLQALRESKPHQPLTCLGCGGFSFDRVVIRDSA